MAALLLLRQQYTDPTAQHAVEWGLLFGAPHPAADVADRALGFHFDGSNLGLKRGEAQQGRGNQSAE